MQHKSRPHKFRLKRPKYPSGRLPYICEDDDRFNGKKVFDMYESDFYGDAATRRAIRWIISHKTIPIHKAPRHMKEKLSILKGNYHNG